MSGTTPIVLAKAEYPYLIRQEDTPIRSYVEISRTRRDEMYYEGDTTLFYLANAELRVEADGSQTIIKVHHTWAADDENDRSKIAWFEFGMVQFVHSYGDQMTFRGVLTKVGFWPKAKGVEDPFAGAVEKKGRDEYGYSKNTGYPYTPPDVSIPRLNLPLVVEFSFHFGVEPERFEKWMKKAMASHKKARLDRERKARELAKERAAKEKARAERQEKVKEWLKTPEGVEYDALRQEIRALPDGKERATWMEKTTPGKRYVQLRDIAYEIE